MRVSDGKERNDASSNEMYGQSDAESSPVEFRKNCSKDVLMKDTICSLTQTMLAGLQLIIQRAHFSDVTPEIPLKVIEQGMLNFAVTL